jgi:uncharacterized protein YeaO (DUF488 family)
MIKDKCISTKITVEESDGLRMLIVANKHYADQWKMHYHEYRKELAPSLNLKRKFVNSKQISWEEYKSRFIEELAKNEKAQELMKELADKYATSETEHVTLLCFCKNRNECHRVLVRERIEDLVC